MTEAQAKTATISLTEKELKASSAVLWDIIINVYASHKRLDPDTEGRHRYEAAVMLSDRVQEALDKLKD